MRALTLARAAAAAVLAVAVPVAALATNPADPAVAAAADPTCRNPGSNAPACRPTPPPTTPPPATPPAGTYPVPADIPADCSTDVAARLLSWLATVPDGGTALLAGGCYRVEQVLEMRGRSGLTVDGQGATLRSYDPPDDQRAMWRLIDSSGMVLRNTTLVGSYTQGGTFTSGLQHAHAVDLRGTQAEVDRLTMSDLPGDCVYFGLGYTTPARSTGSVHDSTCQRISRNGVSVTAGDDIRVERNTFDAVGYIGVDIEPNQGTGWGSARVTVDSNTFGAHYLYTWAVVANAPVTDQAFTNNLVRGRGLRVGVVNPGRTAFRPARLTVTGNTSDTAQQPPAVEIHSTDGGLVSGNTVPLTGGTMATVDDSCGVQVSGNTYPGGLAEVVYTNPACP